MSRWEGPGQVALLLAGATIASLLLIVFFTSETKSRSRGGREVDLQNGGMLSSLGQQVSRLAAGLRESLEDGDEAHGLRGAVGGGMGRKKRSLGVSHKDHPGMEVSRDPGEEEEEDEEGGGALSTTPRPRHGMRHRHRQRQHSRHRYPPSTTSHPPQGPAPPSSTPPPPQREAPEDQRPATAPTDSADDAVSSSREGHAACYGPDQVVLIIALTCALNFACIFLVMALVHICNRNRKCPSSGCDSPLLLLDSDCEVDPKACLVSSAEEDDDYDDDVEVDALLLAKRPSASLFAPFLPPPFPPPASIRHPPPWRPPSSHPPRGGGATRADAQILGEGGHPPLSCPPSRPLLPPAAFSMEDLHILE